MDERQLNKVTGNSLHKKPLKYFDFIMTAFVVILLLSNVIGAAKLSQIDLPIVGTWVFGAGIMFFPISYVIGDVMTEVYGYAHARRCIWAGFFSLLFMALMSFVVVALPPAASWPHQGAYEVVFGLVPRIVFASICAFWVGEFVNSFVLAHMKIITKGKSLWARTIGSTIFGQAADSLIFYPLAFWGADGWTHTAVFQVMATNWFLKVSWEVILTPLTYIVINRLKRLEGLDVYDEGTNYTPFKTKI